MEQYFTRKRLEAIEIGREGIGIPLDLHGWLAFPADKPESKGQVDVHYILLSVPVPWIWEYGTIGRNCQAQLQVPCPIPKST